MHSLPDIVKAIALNNKLDESRDFAAMVQQRDGRAAAGRRTRHPQDLGVKQAPFVVLIGAAMPSVLAEISFVTNPQEAALLKTPAYRQRDRRGAVRRGPALSPSRSSAQTDGRRPVTARHGAQ